ncbi:MAG: phosphoenolpyruvate synthase [Clostridia bacterium]|nr:phosphoenolpyruvate synthase [Clostridia bacterium]
MMYIVPFKDIRRTDVATAGGKGANLGEMVSAGIPVPDGAVLVADAYELFMQENGIDPDMLSGKDEEDTSQMIRSRILQADIPQKIRDEICAFYRSLGAGARVAVRSSATAEDLEDASFAGQQETYLNVSSEAMLLYSVRACYASLWGTRAMHYRAASGYGGQKVALAVVIQQMVESEAAGVLFTKNPVGDGNSIVINASYGLGEAVVSGLVSPDEYLCGRDGTVLKAVIGSKAVKIVYQDAAAVPDAVSDGKGTVQVPVSKTEQGKRVLDDRTIAELVRTALRIEKHYGHPMDIEWAVRGGRIYMLQARAITAGAERAFTDADFAGLPAVKPASGRMRENILFNLEKLPRPYYPLDHDYGNAVGRQKEKLLGEAGIRMNEMTPMNEDGISSFGLGGFRPSPDLIHIPGLIRQMKDDAFNIRKSAEELESCQKAYEQACLHMPASVQETGERLRQMLELIERTSYARFRYAIFPQVLENMSLNRVLARLDESVNSFDLLEGLSYVTADINREMAEIAADISEKPQWKQAVMEMTYGQIGKCCPEIGARFQQFMDRFGWRSDFNCYCFMAKSWNEDPDRFLHSLRTILRAAGNGVVSLKEGQLKFERIMEKVKALTGERKFERFERKVNAVRHYHVIREGTQYLWEAEFGLCRQLLRRAAEYLGTSQDELIYLFAEELFEVCRAGKLDESARERIARRKKKRSLAEAYWNNCISTLLSTGNGDISGVSGSNGKAAGRACIIRGPEEFGKLEKGDILVCPYTDPEWTPLFTLAAGVLVDTGGTLSHAAIVAREYKIPAVLAAGNATSRIHDGDTVMVDGDAGKAVVVHDGGKSAQDG